MQQAVGHRPLALVEDESREDGQGFRHAAGGRTRRWSGRRGARPGSPAAGARPCTPAHVVSPGRGQIRRRLPPSRGRGPPVRRRASRRSEGIHAPRQVGQDAREAVPSPCSSVVPRLLRQLATGASSEKWCRAATSSSASCTRRGPWRCQGWMAPSSSDLFSSGRTRRDVDLPADAQAVAGRTGAVGAVEGEGARAEIAGRRGRTPRRPGGGCRAARPRHRDDERVPPARCSAFSSASTRRFSAPGRRARRSTSTSTRWLRRGSSAGGCRRLQPRPSTRARR